ncbi:protein-disulfide reductase DsbD family protein [Kordiimonas marina]|uniref:protein-disulfide reductase DsbD family protein n=1 Tax=Kordiimonas marina TaxID=2872312 RepID=UPI001FF27D9D|nr:protein-disulfide reductase DsbD domain-containing protein [Kordiimonas marina]MCJ9428897.1 thioredoxin family protein [Kordiimonas marina]
MKRRTSLVLLAALWLLGGAQAASATPMATADDSHSKLALYGETVSVAPGGSVWLGVHITPEKGWHTYWQNPGDSGAAPILTWKLPAGVKASAPLFGAPHAIRFGPLMTYGYEGPSTLLVRLEADSSIADTLPLHLSAEWLTCADICVPQLAELDVTLQKGAAKLDPDNKSLFAAARQALPEPSFWDASLKVGKASSDLTVFMAKTDIPDVKSVRFFPAFEGVLDYPADQSFAFTQEGLTLHFPRKPGAPAPKSASGVLALYYDDGTSAHYEMTPKLDIAADVASQAKGAPSSLDTLLPQAHAGLPIWQAALFAFLGGLILNLMPCVFPVLSLKAFAFISANNRSLAHRRAEGWAYTGGIWASFMVIVSALMALRAGGTAIGWGFQLQSPIFVGLMTLLMVLVALSLGGLIHIRLGVEGAGGSFAAKEGMQGAFFKGVLATLVATPCTAPLMAPAIGFALTQPLLVVFTIFTLLALGLALPFLILSYSTRVAAMMPKPGAWMEKLKEGLAFPMLLTAAWLLYIFDQQTGSAGTLMLVSAIIVSVFAVWLWQQGQGRVLRAIALVCGVAALVAIVRVPTPQDHQAAKTEAGDVAYSDAALNQLLTDGKPVFVYFTADWCITCKVNESLALDREDTRTLFKDKGVTVMEGDWTNRNAEIAHVLARYGRAGVPLYLYFAPGKAEATVLPQMLTYGILKDTLDGR